MGHGGYSLRGSQFGDHSPIERAQSGLTVFERRRGHPQNIRQSIDHSPGMTGEDFSSTDSIVWTNTQPGAEMLFRGKGAQIGPYLGQKGQSRRRPDPLDGGYVH